MFAQIVGGLRFAPETFYNLTLKECELITKGNKQYEEQYLIHMSYAVINGIGSTFGDKKFKFINPFEKERKEVDKKAKNKNMTREQLLKDIEDIKKQFEK